LRIFEARYRALVEDSLAGDSNFILVRTRLETDSDLVPATAPVFEIGTRVRIVASETLPEGRLNLLIQGLEAVRLLEEVEGKPYRQARWIPNCPDPKPLDPEAIQRLVEALNSYLRKFKNTSLLFKYDVLDSANQDLVALLAASLDLPLPEQQFLLEAESRAVMAERLSSLLEFAEAGRTLGIE
jgi:Lon protease-like protein